MVNEGINNPVVSLTFKQKTDIVFELTKLRITMFVTITTIFGYLCAAGSFSVNMIAPVTGILLLACGAAVINHYQERKTDALMDRTKFRPIPSGRITPQNALNLAMFLIVSGSLLLYFGAGLMALGLGLLNLVWYNVIYTPLKKRNAFAIIPGSMVGAIPPAVGWVAGGGELFSTQLLVLALFFFIWQIPHFWLLLLIYGKDYEQAGFPTLTQIFNTDQLGRITFIWIATTVVIGLMIPIFGVVKSSMINFGLLAAGLWMTWTALKLLRSTKEKKYFGFAFRDINIFAILVVVLISIDKLVILF
ncbi:MAG TPA: protoheme IX farnesyltransferase [Ignavibacteriaceae bacterium]|nr:protoheme IX farnesyltransferase [Ignavibacteriaceae bacterium]